MSNLDINKLFNIILVFYLIAFFGSLILVDGYPHNNDILYIFKISSLEGDIKFINGLYGPGYTYFTLIFSDSLNVFTTFICFLVILSSFLISFLLKSFTSNLLKSEKNTIYLISLIFHLIILLCAGFNPSENIFLMLFYNGVLFFILGYYVQKNLIIYILGLFLLGCSVLFRQHGALALFFLYLYYLYFETFYRNQKFTENFKKYFIIGSISILPLIISMAHLISIDSFRMWQTSWRLHMIFFVDMWGDWRDIKYLIKSEKILEFNLLKVEPFQIWIEFRNFSLHALKTLYPFLIVFMVTYTVTKQKIVLLGLGLFILFIFLILPGFHKGYFPIILLCFITTSLAFKNLSNNKFFLSIIIIFLFGHLFYLGERYIENTKKFYALNKDIKNNIVPYLNKNNLKFENIFSDDLNFYSAKIKGNIDNLCNWGGWFMMHPYLNDYHPREAIVGKKNDFCDVKIILTKDETFAKKYASKENISLEFKTDFYHILKVNHSSQL